ncbi:unnamed protein product [Cylicocyclus nassatus]|uniref:Uncharacterized protein n=1 Tax=Cylicocyclus nassatus TaxID=53992 RepID=A0AA36HAV6_CYLNA|nr:unnamed protein product [Cylicocyclus nassatus]
MDLLDNITSMMSNTEEDRYKNRPKKEVKTEPEEGDGSSFAQPSSSFRIPKKKSGDSHGTDVKTESPLSSSSRSSHYDRDVKSERPHSRTSNYDRYDDRDRERSSSHSYRRNSDTRLPSNYKKYSGDRRGSYDRRGSDDRYRSRDVPMEVDSKYGMREEFKSEPRGFGRPIKQDYKPFDAETVGDFVIPHKVEIEMNGLQLDLSCAPESVDRYHITITKILKKKEKDATKGPREDLPTQQRRRALFAVFRQLVKSNPDVFGDDRHKHVYDLGNTFYSVGCNITEEHGVCEFKIAADEIRSDFSRTFLSKGGLKELIFTVQWTGQVFIRGPKLNENDGSRREAARFFDVLTSQILYHGDHHIFGNKFFEKQCEKDANLGEGKCVKSGFEKNVRFLGDSDDTAVPILQIDTKKSPFYNEQSVLQFIRELTGRDPEEAMRVKNLVKKIVKELRGLVVTTTHTHRTLYIHGIIEKNACTQVFETNEGEISVEHYFYEQYRLQLKYPQLPLATERKAGGSYSFYPLEVLTIERGQRVDNARLAGPMTDRMIQQCRLLPNQMREHNRDQLDFGRVNDSENPYLIAFGVQASENFITSEAKVLSAPEIKYKTDTLQPDRSGPMLFWRLRKAQFLRPATVDTVSIIVFDKAMDNRQALDFFHSLARAGRDRGMDIRDDVKVTQLPSEVDEMTERHFNTKFSSCAGKVSIIMCITKIKKDDVHDTIKKLEAKYRIVTQHVSRDTALACIRGGKTLENVLLKFNAKNGGLNHTVSAPRQALSNAASQRDVNSRLFHRKMFVGFELSHAAAQSLYDRQNNAAVKEPTVVGFSYTLGEPSDLSGFWWYQQPRLHTVQYIAKHFSRAFLDYHKNNKQQLPSEVYVYRSGTSEGEYSEVVDEAKEIRAVAEKLRDLNGGRPYRPKITVIVAQTHSNYRIMPARLPPVGGGRWKAQDLNVASGTCADSVIVHPRYREFIMTSQQANIGTSKPTKYTIVVEDEPQMSIVDAEHIAHYLCHAHQQSTLPTHVPAVLYAAENLAKRGRAAWKSKISENWDGASSMSGSRISLREGESAEDFYNRITEELMNSLPHQYFA